MRKPLRFTLIWASFAATLALLASSAYAGARTYYVSPGGTGEACTEAVPCDLPTALDEVVNGDSVVVGPGTYTLGSAQSIARSIDFGGADPANKPVIVTTASKNIYTGVINPPTIHDLRIDGGGGLVLNRGSAERVFVDYTGVNSSACTVGIETTIVDSVCWAHNPTSSSSAILADAPGDEGTATLRNVTAIAESGGSGLFADATSGGVMHLDAFNVIARSTMDDDIRAEFSGFSSSVVTLKNSNYETIEELPPFSTATPAGSNGNQTALPAFLDAAAGDFREATGSPTIEAGLNEAGNGTIAIAGEARVLGLCVGGPGVTDIGAFEFIPTAACPLPPSPPISNKIKLGKLKLNKKNGTATLAVTLPGAGQLTLSGKGVKKIKRSAKGAAKLKLPIKPVGKRKKSLLAKGKLQFKLKLKFAPTGGSAGLKSKKVTLKETAP